jgi:hypothetical protein
MALWRNSQNSSIFCGMGKMPIRAGETPAPQGVESAILTGKIPGPSDPPYAMMVFGSMLLTGVRTGFDGTHLYFCGSRWDRGVRG